MRTNTKISRSSKNKEIKNDTNKSEEILWRCGHIDTSTCTVKVSLSTQDLHLFIGLFCRISSQNIITNQRRFCGNVDTSTHRLALLRTRSLYPHKISISLQGSFCRISCLYRALLQNIISEYHHKSEEILCPSLSFHCLYVVTSESQIKDEINNC